MQRPTDTELRVLQFVAEGKTTAEICKEMNITPNTVRTRRSNLLRAMQLHTTAHAVAEAICQGWIDC